MQFGKTDGFRYADFETSDLDAINNASDPEKRLETAFSCGAEVGRIALYENKAPTGVFYEADDPKNILKDQADKSELINAATAGFQIAVGVEAGAGGYKE